MSITSFEKLFHQSVHMNKMAAIDYAPDFLLPNVYHYSQELAASTDIGQFLCLLGGGNLNATTPFSFSFTAMGCGLLLFTESGAGRITTGNQAEYNVADGQLLYLDCSQTFSIHSVILPWNFKLFFIGGDPLSPLADILRIQNKHLFTLPSFSPVVSCVRSLLSVSVEPDLSELLFIHKSLTEILSTLTISSLPVHASEMPATAWYLVEMKDLIENHYDQPFSLDYCEDLFGINRYRLCREFSNAYGVPPLQLLTRQRIENAKKILLTSDHSVYEVSSMIGYENTNHFINQFKKYVGTTPGSFKRKVQAAQSASHCSALQTSRPT